MLINTLSLTEFAFEIVFVSSDETVVCFGFFNNIILNPAIIKLLFISKFKLFWLLFAFVLLVNKRLINHPCNKHIISIFFHSLHGRLVLHYILPPVIKIPIMWGFKPTVNIHDYFNMACCTFGDGE
jgi:hypothetical protein